MVRPINNSLQLQITDTEFSKNAIKLTNTDSRETNVIDRQCMAMQITEIDVLSSQTWHIFFRN